MKRILLALLIGSALGLVLSPEGERSEEMLARYGDSVVVLRNEQGGGTGFVALSPSGQKVIITNAHVCRVEGLVAESTALSRPFPTRIIEMDAKHDLCIMTAPQSLPALSVASHDATHGQKIWAIGHPLLRGRSISDGNVRKRIKIPLGVEDEKEAEACNKEGQSKKKIPVFIFVIEVCLQEFDAIDTSVRIFPGNSGSPVLDKHGDVVGVVFAGDDASGAYVPGEHLRSLLANY